ncbi:hypothetical protein [Amycolatopsis jejuensis]|uniref:hypothetical protein n=1 Tax=Amycolatopsis jejuensis TaxID=330084 RepID=UPI00068CC5CC|nr:hypothetical protein [Amycolatopsis jejuensis]
MNTELSRRARMLAGIAIAAAVGLTVTACGSSPITAKVPAPSIPANAAQSTPVTSKPADPGTAPARSGNGGAQSVPVLGTVWGPDQEGYGTARPVTIFNGGSPTGLVSHVQWQSWGGQTAIASGTAIDAEGTSTAEGVERQVTVQAFDLGDCKGKLAYRALEWYFPGKGEKFDPHTYLNICTGENVG